MIPTHKNTKTISDMRERAQKLLEQAQKEPGPLYIFYHSKPHAVLLSIEEYQKLIDLAEDYVDSLKARDFETTDKKKIKWVRHEEVQKAFE